MVKALIKKPHLDPKDLGNYRPISLLPGVSKIAEKYVNRTLSAFFESHDLRHPSQTGFRPRQGTETALLAVVVEARKILDSGGSSAIILLDLSAAFDTVNHQILVHRLRNIGVSGLALSWLQSFLEGRSFQVFEDNITSDPLPLQCGVPQGSSLSSTLFNVHMAPLVDIVAPFRVHIVSYADDTQLVVALNQADQLPIDLHTCLEEVVKWMSLSHLKLNGDKTELKMLGNHLSVNLNALWPACMGTVPVPKSEIKSLGIWLDQDLSFKTQARKTVVLCYGLLKMIRKVLPLLPFLAKKLLIQALILSRIDFGNALYLGAPNAVVSRLQIVQNSAARLLTGTGYRCSAKPAMRSVHCLPVQERIHFKALCMAHKSLEGNGPPIIKALIRPYKAPRRLRSDTLHLVEVPPIKRARSWGRLFSYNAAKLWNALPLHLRREPNHLMFRKYLKTWLFS